MNRYILAMLLLLVPILGAADVISSSLYYINNPEKPASLLEVTDFTEYIDPVPKGHKLKDIDAEELIVLVKFTQSIETSKLSFHVNSEHFGSTKAFPYLKSRQNGVLIDISSWLNPGTNNFKLSYPGSQGIESKSWKFNIESRSPMNVKELAGTDDSSMEYSLVLSPNDPLLAYLSSSNDGIHIYVQNLETGKRQPVSEIKSDSSDELVFLRSDSEDYISAPVWSNTGECLYYCHRKDDDYSIRRLPVSSDGSFSEVYDKELTINESDTKQWIYGLAHSPAHDRLVYVSKPGYLDKKPDDPKYVWLVSDLDEIKREDDKPALDFMDRSEWIYKTPNTIYDLAISADGSKLAIAEENKDKGHSIYILDLDSGKKLDTIKDGNKQFSFLQWSPQDDYLLFCSREEIYLYSFEDGATRLIISDQKTAESGLDTKPVWDASGKAVFYICDDQLSSIMRLSFDDRMNPAVHPETFFSSEEYSLNYLIEVDKFGRYLTFLNSGTEYNLKYIKMRSKPQGACRFDIGRNIQLAYKERSSELFKMIAFQPEIKLNSVYLERFDVPSGNMLFRFNNSEQTSPVLGNMATTIKTDVKPDPKFALKFPVVSQYHQKRIKYANFHFISTIAASITLGAGVYLEDTYYEDYEPNTTEGKELFEARSNTAMYIEFNKAQLENLSAMTLLAFIDAGYVKSKPDKNDIKKHQDNFKQQKSLYPSDSIIPMKNIKNQGYGQIKINCYEPETDIYYRRYGRSGWTYAGKSNFIMDNNTYFTISDLSEGKYEVKFSAEFKIDKTRTVSVKEYHNSFVYNKFSTRSSSFFSKLPAFVPGWQQIKRKQYLKSIAYLGLAVYSGWQCYNNMTLADDAYDEYGSAIRQKDILQSRIEEREYTGKSVSYGIMFSFNYLNNLFDVFLRN